MTHTDMHTCTHTHVWVHTQTHTHTHTESYIPWIHTCVTKRLGCGNIFTV